MLIKTLLPAAIGIILTGTLYAQKTTHYDLVRLLNRNKFVLDTGNHARASGVKDTITTQRVLWLKGEKLANETIDIDLRRKAVILESFLGIAFPAADTANYDVIFFRPFRFHSTDTPPRKWSVQYMGMPKYTFDVLRKAHPLIYENSVNPVPAATDWFHVTIVLK